MKQTNNKNGKNSEHAEIYLKKIDGVFPWGTIKATLKEFSVMEKWPHVEIKNKNPKSSWMSKRKIIHSFILHKDY